MPSTEVPGRYNVALNKEDPADVWEFSQKSYNHVGSNGNEDDSEDITVQQTNAIVIPLGTKQDMRTNNPDYKAGDVKSYTSDEIEQYELDLRVPDDD